MTVAVLAAGCGDAGAGDTAAPERREVVTPFDAHHRAAAGEFGVSFELLRATAAAQTAHHRVDLAQSESGQAGVMGLSPEFVAEGARLLGVAEDEVRFDDRTNVRAAAALILDRRLRGETWNGAALALTGLRHEALRARWLRKYARHLSAAGEPVPQEPAVVASAATAGDYPPASFVPAHSENYTNASRSLSDVNYVIIHDVEGSYESCISWFQNPSSSVSAHYVIADEGDITQMVYEQDIAWHAGNWSYNQQSVGIEHEGYAGDPNSYPESMYVASAALTRYLTDRYSIPRTRAYVIAHSEVPNTFKSDPGPFWEWDHYMELVESGGGVVVPEPKARLVGYVREGDLFDGPGIEGATVSVEDGPEATTDEDGYYEIEGIEPGVYTVTATADGYEDAVDEKNIPNGGSTYWKSFSLDPEDGAGDDDRKARGAHGLDGGFGCSVAPTQGSPVPFAGSLFAALALALRRRARAASLPAV